MPLHKPAINRQELAAEYGWSLAILKSNNQLWDLFNSAVRHTWTPERFVAEMRTTDWFQNHSAAWRQATVLRLTDPSEYQGRVDAMKSHVLNVWGAAMGAPMDTNRADRLAKTAIQLGWTDEQLTDRLVNSTNFMRLLKRDSLGGNAAQASQQIDQYAAAYGVGVGNHWKAQQLKDILSGGDTMDGTLNRIKELSKSKYTAFADQIDAGKTIDSIADPYRQEMAQLLELNPNDIGVDNHHIQQALQFKNQDGKAAPLSLSDFGDAIRRDPRWQLTQNARDSVMSLGYNLAKSFGLSA